MYTNEQGLYVAHGPEGPISITGKMANRHGLIAGATTIKIVKLTASETKNRPSLKHNKRNKSCSCSIHNRNSKHKQP